MSQARATLRIVGQGDGDAMTVLFNPASLKVSLTNKLQDEESGSGGSGGQARQATRVTTTKLETELLFDTTHTGHDVRDLTSYIKYLGTASEGEHPRPPNVEFRWGRFSYVGVIESLTDTLDFWSYEGVPLRSTLQLVMQGTKADEVAEGAPERATLNTIPPLSTGATAAATRVGAPAAGRQVAAANGMENMRAPAGGTVAIKAGAQFKAAASFSAGASAGAGAGAAVGFGAGAVAAAGASASAGFGAGIGAGAAAGVGVGASAGGGFAAGAGASFAAGASAGAGLAAAAGATAAFGAGAAVGFGASATAGVSASAGAFAGLGVSKTSGLEVRIDPQRLLPQPRPPVVSLDGTGGFDVTGRATVAGGSSGLSAQYSAGAGVGVI